MQINQDRKIDQIIGKEKESLARNKKYSFEIMLERWMTYKYAIQHSNITKTLTLAALIPPSTVKVERTFSLMRSTWTRKRLPNENLGACRNICKYRLFECDFLKIRKWRVASRLLLPFTYVYC